jgi:hypothetical protein
MKKKKVVHTCLWYYPGGMMHKVIGSKEHIEIFARNIRNCGGVATTYPFET